MPMLSIGALYGRMIGESLVLWFGEYYYYGDKYEEKNAYHSWMDPGAIALIGAASFFAGVSRLTISLTVIMIEITNDVTMLLPVMTAIMVAKLVGDQLTHPIYHALLEVKCIPILDEEPVVYTSDKDGKSVLRNLELHAVSEVMTRDVKIIRSVETVKTIAELLLSNRHMSFPVVDDKGFCGVINRIDLTNLLQYPEVFRKRTDPPPDELIKYHSIHTDKIPEEENDILHAAKNTDENLYIHLLPYTNRSSVALPDNFSLHRAYLLLRTLGMRQIILLDDSNQPSGILTRKDLMGFAVEAKLQESVSRRDSDSDGTRDKSDKTIPNGNKSTLPMISTTNVTTISNEQASIGEQTTAEPSSSTIGNLTASNTEAFQPTYRVI
jgi:chloride channel 7